MLGMVSAVDGAHLPHRRAGKLDQRNLLVARQLREGALRREALGPDGLSNCGCRLHRDAGAAAQHVVVHTENRLSEAIVGGIQADGVRVRPRRLAERLGALLRRQLVSERQLRVVELA
eukprot:5184237-Prymnesium_polylepis.2